MSNAIELPSDETVDAAYEAYCAELDAWDIVGPMRKNGGEDYYMARRLDKLEADPIADSLRLLDFTTKQHAVACVAWHGLRAALEQFESASAGASGRQSDTDTNA